MTVYSSRVVVVDDDPWRRRGLEGLHEQGDIDVVAALSHGEALERSFDWQGVDAAVVDAHDPDQEDRYPGVAVVERIRQSRSKEETRILVVSHFMTNDALRLRMKEAGADYYYEWDEVRTPDRLAAAILHPDACHRPCPYDPGRLAEEGLKWNSSRPSKVLGYRDRFGPDRELTRREVINTRRAIQREGAVHEPAYSSSSQQLSAPTWRFLSRMIDWLLGRGPGNAGHGPE